MTCTSLQAIQLVFVLFCYGSLSFNLLNALLDTTITLITAVVIAFWPDDD